MSKAIDTPTTRVGALSGVPVKPNRVAIRPEWFPNAPDPDAYALVLKGRCLEPELHDGEMAICSPAAPIEVGRFVALWPADGSQPILKRLVMEPLVPVGTKLHPDSDVVPIVVVEMLNPRRQLAIRIDKLKAMHRVVGAYRAKEIAGARIPPVPTRSRRRKGCAA